MNLLVSLALTRFAVPLLLLCLARVVILLAPVSRSNLRLGLPLSAWVYGSVQALDLDVLGCVHMRLRLVGIERAYFGLDDVVEDFAVSQAEE
ncbi:hypothetical protein SVAN01_00129 [Stagonosporopsis vannaccii]|nr:hypothetical protein SVAN01_00129 [Stagonosporopsis vannaccii]